VKTRSFIASMTILAIAALLTIYAMLHAAAWQLSAGRVAFVVWALTPYLVVATVIRAVGSKSGASRIASVISSAAVLVFAAFMYVDAIFIHVSSTSALIFLFAPLYLTVGGVMLFVVITVVGNKWSARRRS
jgi:hypothetical protein